MLGKHFRLLFGVVLLLISAESEALTIQSGSSVYHFNTNSPKLIIYNPNSNAERETISDPYVTVNLGYAKQQGSESPVLSGGGSDFLVYTPGRLHGLFEQISFGYAFNDYVSVEVGGIHFDDGAYQITSYNSSNKTGQVGSPAKTTVKTYAADALLKLSLPIERTGLSLFAAGGGAYQRISFNSDFAGFSTSNNIASDGLTTSTRNTGFVPMLSAGFAYEFTRHFSLLTTYDYLFQSGKISKNYSGYMPNAHIVTVGIMAIF